MGSLFLVAIIIMTVIIILGHLYSKWFIKIFIADRHKDIQEICETGRVPEKWTKPERRMKNLMRYVERSRLMADEEVRKEVSFRLEEALQNWQNEMKLLEETNVQSEL